MTNACVIKDALRPVQRARSREERPESSFVRHSYNETCFNLARGRGFRCAQDECSRHRKICVVRGDRLSETETVKGAGISERWFRSDTFRREKRETKLTSNPVLFGIVALSGSLKDPFHIGMQAACFANVLVCKFFFSAVESVAQGRSRPGFELRRCTQEL